MNFLRQHSKRIYIGTTAVALILAAALCFDYGVSRQAEESEAVETVTSVAEKEKKDKVLISVSTETIRTLNTDTHSFGLTFASLYSDPCMKKNTGP